MEMEQEPTTLEAEVRRLRAGIVKTAASTDPQESELVRVVWAASQAWDGQLDRVDRFSLPLLSSSPPTGNRASATTTSRLFLDQLASDYRRVGPPELDLRELEDKRNSDRGVAVLERAGVVSRPVAPLAVGQYLAFHERAPHRQLRAVLLPWLFSEPALDSESRYAASFGDVLGPLVRVALDRTQTEFPSWSDHVGAIWCEEFLAAGAQILKYPALLNPSQAEEQVVVVGPRQDTVDVTATVDHVLSLAAELRPVEDVRVNAAGGKPKIDLVLSGDKLEEDEFRQFMTSVEDVPADVMIIPTYLSGQGTLTAEVNIAEPDELEP
jgi:hypothetical protein